MAFDHVFVIERRRGDQDEVDIGRLAEDLLFYGKVTLHVGPGGLKELVRGVGAQALLELMRRGALQVTYADNVVVVQTHMDGVIAYYDPGVITTSSLAIERKAQEVFKELGSGNAAEHSRRFLELAIDRPHEESVCDDVRGLLDDIPTLERFVGVLLAAVGGLPPGHPPLHFRPAKQSDGRYTVDTNLDLSGFGNVVGAPLDPARLIAFLGSFRSKVRMAGGYGADLDTNAIDAALLEAHVEVRNRALSTETLMRFQQMTLGPGNTVAEAIRSGERTFADLVRVVDKAERFRDWLRDKEPDAELLHEYYRAATETSWISTLPAKTFRWSIAVGLGVAVPGVAGLLVGGAFGFFDTFLLDKLAAGWKPNQFVDGELRDFVRKHGP